MLNKFSCSNEGFVQVWIDLNKRMIANFTLPPELRLRVLFQLLIAADLKGELHEVVKPGIWYRLPYCLTAQTIGMIVNLTRSHVSRQLNSWREAGLARKEGID